MEAGVKANKRGKELENSVFSLLSDKYQYVERPDFLDRCNLGQPIFSREYVVGESIYEGKKRRIDFILFHPEKRKDCLVIQCKWQAVSGSVEEKYPFEVLNIKKNDFDTIIILDGGGASKGAKGWLKKQAGEDKKLKAVLNLGEFQRYFKKYL